MKNDLLINLDNLHTTELGVMRIRRNLSLADIDVVEWCKDKIRNSNDIARQGKNWYAHTGDAIITVNTRS
ncbi:MAG: DUF3781 domain-containing protein, partial [Oscillospiraceae bacterium]|nr:DUF3781 domain-containing protein [Oscillospiraceae bacterium]